MRPLYENEQTQSAEAELKRYIEARWSCQLKKMPIFYQVDFAAVRGDRIFAWAEVKCRSHSIERFPTIILSASKWLKLIEFYRSTPHQSFFIVGFTDTVRYVKVSDVLLDVEYKWGGRTVQKRDKDDEEPIIHLPVDLMFPL
jgi:hypothetical protein